MSEDGPDAEMEEQRRRALLLGFPLAAVTSLVVLVGELRTLGTTTSAHVRIVMALLCIALFVALLVRRIRQVTAERVAMTGGVALAGVDLLARVPTLGAPGSDQWLVAWLSYTTLLIVAPYVAWPRRQARPVAGAVLVAGYAVLVVAALGLRFSLPAVASAVVPLVLLVFVEALSGRAALLGRHEAQARSRAQEGLFDLLTGLPNRRGLLPHLEALEVGDVVMLGDVDRFKGINDLLGHAEGDLVLQRVARALRAGARAGDVVGRWGGEEFVVVARHDSRGDDPDVPLSAVALAERLRGSVAASVGHGVTISLGVARVADADADWQDVVRRADVCLYRAKTEGRDRVVTVARP